MQYLAPMRPHHREATKESCDIVVDEGKLPEVTFAPIRTLGQLARAAPNLAAHTTISVPHSRLGGFFERVLPRLHVPVILVTTDCCSDRSSPQPYASARFGECPTNNTGVGGEEGYAERPRDWSFMLHHPRISHWFSDNWRGGDRFPHGYGLGLGEATVADGRNQKLTVLPIGISDQRARGSAGDREVLLTAMSRARPNRLKPPRAYANFHHSDRSYEWYTAPGCSQTRKSQATSRLGLVSGHTGYNVSRLAAFDALHPWLGHVANASQATAAAPATGAVDADIGSCVYFDHPAPPHEAWGRQAQHFAFVIAPHGRGLDTHRVWEALMMRSIPIVLRSPLDALYSSGDAVMPVKVVESWAEVNCSSMARWQRELAPLFDHDNATTVLQRLAAEFWGHRISEKQQQLRQRDSAPGRPSATSVPWSAFSEWKSSGELRQANAPSASSDHHAGCRIAFTSSQAAPLVSSTGASSADPAAAGETRWEGPALVGEQDFACTASQFGWKREARPLGIAEASGCDPDATKGVQHIPIIRAGCNSDIAEDGAEMCRADGCDSDALRREYRSFLSRFTTNLPESRGNDTSSAPFAVIALRGGCSFGQKALAAQNAGASALIVINARQLANDSIDSGADEPAFAMQAEENEASAVHIASVMVDAQTGRILWRAFALQAPGIDRSANKSAAVSRAALLSAVRSSSPGCNDGGEDAAERASDDAEIPSDAASAWRPDLHQVQAISAAADQLAAKRDMPAALEHFDQALVLLQMRLGLPVVAMGSSRTATSEERTAALAAASASERLLWRQLHVRRAWAILAGSLWESYEEGVLRSLHEEVARDMGRTSSRMFSRPEWWCTQVVPTFGIGTKLVAGSCHAHQEKLLAHSQKLLDLQLKSARSDGGGLPRRAETARTRANGPVRLGYISSFLGEHPIGHLVSRLFAHHVDRSDGDEQRVHVFVYEMSRGVGVAAGRAPRNVTSANLAEVERVAAASTVCAQAAQSSAERSACSRAQFVLRTPPTGIYASGASEEELYAVGSTDEGKDATAVAQLVQQDQLDLLIDLDAWTTPGMQSLLPLLALHDGVTTRAHWLGQVRFCECF